MDDQTRIQEYLNNLRRHLTPRLRPGIGVSSFFYPASSGGGLVELRLGPRVGNVDSVLKPTPTVNDALAQVPQRAFGGNLKGFHFSGTNVIFDGDRILLIKADDDPAHWSDEAASKDLALALQTSVQK